MIQTFKEDYNSPFAIVKFYFRRIIKVIICMLKDISPDNLILDFGCGKQYLKTASGFRNIIGYDIVDRFTDIGDYEVLTPDVIICNHVLEHLDAKELGKVLDNFRKMNPKFIITGVPTENFISRVCASIGKPHGYFEHKTKIKDIHYELSRRFILTERKNVMTLIVVSKWK